MWTKICGISLVGKITAFQAEVRVSNTLYRFYKYIMEKRTRYIYEIVNKLNGKTYIGQHTVRENKTISTDIYWGSGKYICNAISKYGIENFEKNILISGEFTKEEINELEIQEISKQRELGKAEYNISDGGESPFTNSDFARQSGIKADKQKISESLHNYWSNITEEEKERRVKKAKETCKRLGYTYKTKGTTGYHHTEEAKRKMSENRTGKNNGSFGTHWYTNGKENIKATECPEGFKLGRVINLKTKDN